MEDIVNKVCGNSSPLDEGINLNGSYPRFSACFQNTFMVWVPSGLFWLFLPNYISMIISKKDVKYMHKSSLGTAKTIVNWMLCLFMLTETILLYMANLDTHAYGVMLLAGVIKTATMVVVLSVGKMADRKGISTSSSGLMFVFWLLLATTGSIPVYTHIIEQVDEVYIGRHCVNIAYWILVTLQFILHFFGDTPPFIPTPGEKEPCPEAYASYPSKLSFTWMGSLISRGYTKTLTDDDIFDVRTEDKGNKIMPEFEEFWKQETLSCKNYNISLHDKLLSGDRAKSVKSSGNKEIESNLKKPSLLKVIFKMCRKEVIGGIMIRLVHAVLVLCNSLLLGMLIAFIQSRSTEHAWKGYVLACSFFLNAMLALCLKQQCDVSMKAIGLRMTSILTSSIYRKSLRIDQKTKKSFTVGELVNLMSVDAQQIGGIIWSFVFFVSTTFRILFCVYLLWNTLGTTVLIGLSLMLLLLPISSIINNKQKELEQQLMKNKDARSKVMSEIINGIKVLKFYVWEPSFEQKVTEMRDKERIIITKLRYIDTARVVAFGSIPFLVTVVTFAIYIFYDEGNILDAGTAFTTLSLFEGLKYPLQTLTDVLQSFIQQLVSLKRIGEFLQSEELDPENVQHKDTPDMAIRVNNGTFSWCDKVDPALNRINLDIPKGQLVAIVGQVGMGKSSLLSAFLGEMDKLDGSVNVNGAIGYVPQQAWIQNAKLKDNILFGKQYDKKIYYRVIDACSLQTDFDMLVAGDNTEIGENGINLSGGQKQRVNLARAVYYNADIYLMDDPLSAVDSHVGKHIFDEVIGDNGLLKNKTRVLVTHGVHWLSKMDKIIVMKDGKISDMGTYSDLKSHDGAFSQFLRTYHPEPEKELEASTKEAKFLKRNDADIDEDLLEKDSDEMTDSTIDFNDLPSSDGIRRQRQRLGRSISFDNDFKGRTSKTSMIDKSKVTSKCLKKVDRVSRQDSQHKPEVENGGLIHEEETLKEDYTVCVKYFKAFGYVWILFILLMAILTQAASAGENIILSLWTEDSVLKERAFSNTTEYKFHNLIYIAVFAGFGFGHNIFETGFSLMIFLRSIIVSKKRHGAMLKTILRCPMSFFDTTPVARILTLFMVDINVTEDLLPLSIRTVISSILKVIATVAVISYNLPLFLTVFAPAIVIFKLFQKCFVLSIRQIEQIRRKSLSPVVSYFGETSSGTSTIRAYGVENYFIQNFQKKLEKHIASNYAGMCANQWLLFRLETMGYVFVLASALLAVMSSDITGSVAGLCVIYTMKITGNALNALVYSSVRLFSMSIGIERVNLYIQKETEAPLVTDKRPSKNWPTNGEISIENYQTRYRPGLDLVLRGINCNIQGGEKIGVVGRTGAGKSSLMSSLFRLIESADGKIEIDGINIAEIGLHDLRSHLTILPQDPVLFSGTLKLNLDPFENFSNDELWTALEHAHLRKFVSGIPDGLLYDCGEGGQNLSHGQRQLVCLARALLHKTKILILDEATAAVDMETDDLIQKTIRTEFKDSTILAIAHRLNTIMDYDKVLVLGHGQVLEYDTPENLLQNKKSVFFGMAKKAHLI